MSSMSATIGRICDEVNIGWKSVSKDWQRWPETFKALRATYYVSTFAQADQSYCLAGLQTVKTMWDQEHGQKQIAQEFLDQACAHEVHYHASRGRTFRRASAALSTCWRGIVTERPERVTDRAERAKTRARLTAKGSN